MCVTVESEQFRGVVSGGFCSLVCETASRKRGAFFLQCLSLQAAWLEWEWSPEAGGGALLAP